MRLSSTTLVDSDEIAPARKVKIGQSARKTVLADLSKKKKRCIDVGDDADTRDGLAGLWLCTDASEPQHTSVIK